MATWYMQASLFVVMDSSGCLALSTRLGLVQSLARHQTASSWIRQEVDVLTCCVGAKEDPRKGCCRRLCQASTAAENVRIPPEMAVT